MLNEIREIAQKTTNPYLADAKKNDKKIMGYFCCYVPEELIHAAGFIPYRMRAVENHGTAKSDAYFSAANCSFVRQCFNKALDDEYLFLDGVIFMNSCDHLRRMYDNWKHSNKDPKFLYMLPVPHKSDDICIEEFTRELNVLKTRMEEFYGLRIDESSLKNSIQLYNKQRNLLMNIYNSRKGSPVPLKGSEFTDIMLAVTSLPVEVSIGMLEKVLEEIKDRKTGQASDVRLYLGSGYHEERELLDLMEESGAVIVGDNSCLGIMQFDLNVDENVNDPLRAIAQRYLKRISCPRMVDDYRLRLDFMNAAIKEFKVDAVILDKLEFCTLWSGMVYLYKKELEKTNIPQLKLSRELYSGATGQLKTRVQALIEGVKNRRQRI
jgi:benzoyl-CoA reductase subunit C